MKRAAFDRAVGIVGASACQRKFGWLRFDGHLLKQVCYETGKSRSTVRTQLTRLYALFGVRSHDEFVHVVYLLDRAHDAGSTRSADRMTP